MIYLISIKITTELEGRESRLESGRLRQNRLDKYTGRSFMDTRLAFIQQRRRRRPNLSA